MLFVVPNRLRRKVPDLGSHVRASTALFVLGLGFVIGSLAAVMADEHRTLIGLAAVFLSIVVLSVIEQVRVFRNPLLFLRPGAKKESSER